MMATLPTSVVVVSQNLWLIPFKGAWMLGRSERCADGLVGAANELHDQAGRGTALVIVAVQEAWAFRAGVFWPAFWLCGRVEALLLRHRTVSGRHELRLYNILKNSLLLLVALATLTVQAWLPLIRGVMWDPKLRIADALKHRALLPWHSSSTPPFAGLPPWSWPPCLMDGGLHMSASAPADESGFVAFARAGHEGAVQKGVQWARWGSLAVLNTHMVFDCSPGSERRRMQREALAQLVGALLGLPPEKQVAEGLLYDEGFGLSGVPDTSRTCRAVLVTGDFNHALRSQCTNGEAGAPPSGESPSVYTGPWLPKDAALDYLLEELRHGGAARVRARSLARSSFACRPCTCSLLLLLLPHRSRIRVPVLPRLR
jgi:hypothetical protein